MLTRLRLSARAEQSGAARVPQSVVIGHTLVGLLAVLSWAGYLTRVGNRLNLVVGAVALLPSPASACSARRAASRPCSSAT